MPSTIANETVSKWLCANAGFVEVLVRGSKVESPVFRIEIVAEDFRRHPPRQ
ncbi:hypothetical protein QLH52_01460 [Methylomonas sp. OY6]|uniref:Uncharacterized protein n=1 Tax=Methylomonas defluvii TaxID=3045149 RepID=A0ABU4UAA2_9GAMM|nr:hypothetical protein [Methylomonas sp. OY6]MDX8125937.1 hypothetical protein [Methylomonas sp. OY6]